MRCVLFLLVFTLLAGPGGVARGASTTVPFPLPRVPDTVELERVSGSSYLRVPPACYRQECALVVVSHPRGQTAGRMRASASVTALVDALLAAPFAVLLSDDGGPATWGSPAALAQVAELHGEAADHFAWNGRTYALGLSMGGLLALRSALPGSPYAVSGVALIDAWTDIRAAWHSATTRRVEIQDAYGLPGQPPADLNPLTLAEAAPPLPLFVVASPDDRVVPMPGNGERLFTWAQGHVSEFVKVSGPHLGGNRFTPALATRLAQFFTRLEARAIGAKR
ncbi:alpha/beta hydrolase family protein [Deinococcus hopiensis]|uniref:alpha/beta hydrolase family protein n=1 Tax=Deinococcus hopiensis TaxID=309885 RepID=UPI000A0435CC|nr:alpha/beta hydrolase [Deinococcus hopiensis]